MKKILLFLVMALPLFVLAQKNAGIITYKETIKMNWKPPADLEPEMKAQIEEMRKHMPKSFSNYKELVFNEEMAYFHPSAKQEEESEQLNAQGGQRGGRMMRMMGGGDKLHYWNLKKGNYVEKLEFFGRDFLIKDKPLPLTWKILGEVKEIAGYQCQKASAMKDTTEIIAWFCPFIPVPAGPDGNGQLPGMILELVYGDDGMFTTTAESIEFKEIKTDDYEVPKGGKVVDRTEFETIRDEKMAEMREEWKNRRKEGGGGGHMRMEAH